MRRRTATAIGVAAALCAGLIAWSASGGPSPTSVPRLVDETASSGVDHVYDGEFPFFVGGGVATFDCNGDGFPELFMAGGTRPAALYENKSATGGALRFSLLQSPVTDLVAVTGAYPLDIDSDAVTDLVVLRRGDTRVLRGTGDCGFEDMTDTWGLGGQKNWTVGFSATWENGSTLPTLAFGNYLVPDTYDCADNTLWRPDETGYHGAERLPAHCTLSILFSDWNHDGHTDLRVSNDRNYDKNAREQLWRTRPGEQTREYGATDGWRPLTIWGMGIASQDLTGDGRPEIFLTSQADNKLQTLEKDTGGPSYVDIALERGVTAQHPYTGSAVLPSTAWHPEFDDVNNDGRMDLFITKGNVDAQVDYAADDPNNLLLGRADGTFEEAGDRAGVASTARSRGAALVDLNLDGMLDLVVMNRRVPAEIRRNVGTGTAEDPVVTGHWVGVRLRQPGTNAWGVGSWVEVRSNGRTVTRELTVGGGHASGDLGWMHFGLGAAERAEVRVTFPGSTPGPWMPVDADGFYEIARGGTATTRWVPGS